MSRFEPRGGGYTPDQIDGVVRNPKTGGSGRMATNDDKENLIIELSPTGVESYLEIDHADGSAEDVYPAVIYFRPSVNATWASPDRTHGQVTLIYTYNDDDDEEDDEAYIEKYINIMPSDWKVTDWWYDTQYDRNKAVPEQDLAKIFDDYELREQVTDKGNMWLFNPNSVYRWPDIMLDHEMGKVLWGDEKVKERMRNRITFDFLSAPQSINRRKVI